MRTKIFSTAIGLLLTVSSCHVEQPGVMNKFTGMWKLDKYESLNPTNGKWQDAPNRVGYTGYILYDGIGHMAVQLLPPGFKDVATKKSIDSMDNDELRKTLKLHSNSFSYFANCNIIKGTDSIEHHRVSSNNPQELGTTITRRFKFKNDTLILTATELIGGLTVRLRWVKLE